MARAFLIRLFLGLLLVSAEAGAGPAGTVFILSGPSGTGKSTLARRLVREVPGLVFAVSHTTRPPRPGEREGADYFFVDDARFEAMLAKGQFQEWSEIYGRRYGLSREWLARRLESGQDILLDLDSAGARAMREQMPGAVSVFLLPPSAAELARRLRGRHSEGEEQIDRRLGLAGRECARYAEYDYLVVNADVDQAFRELQAIILAGRARCERRRALAEKILAGFRE
jgi:guanylate kinase